MTVSVKQKAITAVGLVCLLLFLSLSFAGEILFPPSPYNCENLPEKYQQLPERQNNLYVIWRDQQQPISDFRTQLLEQVNPLLLQQPSEQIKLWLRTDAVESFTFADHPRKDGSVIGAVVVLDGAADDLLQKLNEELHYVAGYQVNTSVPLEHPRNWKDGEISPGVISMSFFQRREGMDDKQFKDYWHCAHTPFALEIHPLWHYERNPVVQALTSDAPAYDAVVPLHMHDEDDLSFNRFFGADGNWAIYNALRIQSDVSNFIDLDLIETVPMEELILRSQPQSQDEPLQ